MPSPASSLSAVIVSGGKQYRVSPGDRILVDRMAGDPGSEVTLDRVLMLADGDDVKVGVPAVDGVTVTARVIGPARGPKIDVLRYKSKKRVRVHRGARADLTALEILTVGGRDAGTREKGRTADKTAEKKADKPGKAEKAEGAGKTERPAGAEKAAAEKPAPRRAAKKPAGEAAAEKPGEAAPGAEEGEDGA